MRWLLGIALLVAAVLSAPRAFANGRNPHTVAIALAPGDNQTLYVSTTFGLVISKDGGCTFNWVCEQALGYGGTWDPRYAIGADGTIFATTYEGLRASTDGGCSFDVVPPTAGLWVDAVWIGPTGQVWAATAETGGINDVLASTTSPLTLASKGMSSAEVWWKSVAVAPSDDKRVYITGYQVADTPAAHFYRSDDGGAQWMPQPLADVRYGGTPVLRVRAVDPTNPDIVFMSSEAANPPLGDLLYRSTDGGATWTEVLATDATVHDVVIREGGQVLVATQIKTTTALAGGTLYASRDGGATFTAPDGAPKLACLAQSSDGTLYGCGANWEPDFMAVARSVDGGATWEKVWRFVEMADALQCAPGTVQHDTCDVELWDCPACGTDLKRQFGAKGPACGPGAADPAVPKQNGGGCCGAGDPLGALWGLVVLGWLGWRRRCRTRQPGRLASSVRQLG